MGERPIVSLLSDFGARDAFVGAMKGVILSVCPDASLVDLCHEVSPHDIRGGSFLLRTAATAFPTGTIHLAVVDPGVGGPRRPILAEIDGQTFVAPDNGLLSYPLAFAANCRIRHLTAHAYWRHPVSPSFHGRDVFAPVAGHLASGVDPGRLGPEIGDPVRIPIPRPVKDAEGNIRGTVIWVDRFGNCVTDVALEDLARLAPSGADRLRARVGGRPVGPMVRCFTEVEPGASGAMVGSAGHVELFCNRGNFAREWRLQQGDEVILETPAASRGHDDPREANRG
jgi:S-adenosyl-L-methionine hydrolase (adenosine-forming)